MTTYQIWGQFPRNDEDDESLTTVSCFRKDQLMGDGITRMVDFEREFATNENEDFILLREFEVDLREYDELLLGNDTLEAKIVSQIYQAFLDGWWRITKGER